MKNQVPIAFALLLATVASTSAAPVAVPHPDAFALMEGTWAGKGVVDLSDGRTYVLRCNGTYTKGTSTLDLKVTCDYGKYKLGLVGTMLADKDGGLTGTFSDSILHIPGKLTGTKMDGAISAKVSAFGISGNLDVKATGKKQTISVVPDTSGTGVNAIAIVMLPDLSRRP